MSYCEKKNKKKIK